MKILLIVLDSLGIGAMPDAPVYGDEFSVHTLVHTLEALSPKHHIQHLEQLGLLQLIDSGVQQKQPIGFTGKIATASRGKDTVTGHWEMAGIITQKAFPTFPNGFPESMIQEIKQVSNRNILGNKVASGTEILKELGEQHLATGDLIIYTSADSVLQIAAHEEVIPLKELYRIAENCRKKFMDPENMINRIICRPFIGYSKDTFIRTSNRKDYAIPTPLPNALSVLYEHQIAIHSIGKISDIFSNISFDTKQKTKDNNDGIQAIIHTSEKCDNGLIFANLVDFDAKYGHRRDPEGYAQALVAFDRSLPAIMNTLAPNDWLFLTADHGCDPKAKGTDHTREYVPIICWSPIQKNVASLGERNSLADIGETILSLFGQVPLPSFGESFADILTASYSKKETGDL